MFCSRFGSSHTIFMDYSYTEIRGHATIKVHGNSPIRPVTPLPMSARRAKLKLISSEELEGGGCANAGVVMTSGKRERRQSIQRRTIMRINVKCILPINAKDVDTAISSVQEKALEMFGERADILVVEITSRYATTEGGVLELRFDAVASFTVAANPATAYEFARVDGLALGASVLGASAA